MKLTFILTFALALYYSNLSANELDKKKEYVLSSKTLKNAAKKIDIDLNIDGKTDRVEVYKNSKLFSVEKDSNYDGKIDKWITFSPYTSSKTPIETYKSSSLKNSKIDHIKKIYHLPLYNLLVITNESDSNHDGIFDKKWNNTIELAQLKDEISCNENMKLDDLEILKLVEEVQLVNQTLEKEYYVSDQGFKIHSSCMNKWGADKFPTFIENGMKKGFQCLKELAEINTQSNPTLPNGAAENLNALDYLLQTTGISIVCNEDNYNWKGVAAHASTSPGEVIKGSSTEHPFISINYKYPAISSNPTLVESQNIIATLFHEQFHNLGYLHGESIEYPYACETCCLEAKGTEKNKDACKICSGNYLSSTDKNYLIDVIAWGKSSNQSKRSEKAIILFQKEFPKERFGLFAYAAAAGNNNSPIGIEVGRILKQKFPSLSSQEESFIKASEQYSDNPNFKKTTDYSKVIAEAHISLYYEQDAEKALDLLEKNIKQLKNILAVMRIAKSDDSYIYLDIKNKVFDLLVDIWMQGYPDANKPQNLRAKNLLQSTGLLNIR